MPEKENVGRSLAAMIRARAGRGKGGALAAAVAVQTALLLVAVGVIIAVPSGKDEAAFKAGKRVSLPPRELEHRAALNDFQQAAGAALPVERLSTESLLPENSLPELPALPSDSFSPLVQEAPVPEADALLAESGLNAALTGLPGGFSELDLFGIREGAGRFVILVDTSNSMFERQRDGVKYRFDFTVIKDEIAALVAGLQPDTQFNLAIYEGGSLAWQPNLMPATLENKQAAEAWLRGLSESPSASISSRKSPGPRLIEGGGTRLDTGLRQVFGFEPEVIFIVTDGEINRSGRTIPQDELLDIIRGLQRGLAESARIHVIHYQTAVTKPEEIATMRAIAGRNSGRFRQVEAVLLE
ncbi:VWA domain-containing protein [Ruficoccus amylovorans]|uniref:VWA domain-containing protein n=1 Tax=Ruficoccus amylovorans TaxID=1804625 RepID=A0A842HGN2_9BACT|nr:vWA domain-containing protein [Ruficoccus amylovorans]MBC2594714.1 VWA domain-containing protein [Ruficoccus amylovorans]